MRVFPHRSSRPRPMLATHLGFLLTFLLLLCSKLEQARADWLQSSTSSGISYFLAADPGAYRIERYSLENESWLGALPLPSNYGPPTTFHVSEGTVYVAFDRALKRFDLEGGHETHVANFGWSITQILRDRSLLFVNLLTSATPHLFTLNVDSFTILQTTETTEPYGIPSILSIAPGLRRLYGQSVFNYPSDLTSYSYNASGNLAQGSVLSQTYGFPPANNDSWVFPSEQQVAVASGAVYWSSNLTYAAKLVGRGRLQQLAFLTNGDAVALWDGQVVRYSPALLPMGSLERTNHARALFTHGRRLFLFNPDESNRGIQVESMDVTQVTLPAPSPAPNPIELQYNPTGLALDREGNVLLASPEYPALFRWNPVSQTYLDSVALIDIPASFAYSSNTHTAYLGYTNGTITKLDLNEKTRIEQAFATVPSMPLALAVVGDFLFVASAAGHQTFDVSGRPSPLQYRQSRPAKVFWSPALGRLFYRSSYDSAVNSEPIYTLSSEPSLPLGSIGPEQPGLYFTDSGQPLLVFRTGHSVLTSGGRLINATNLTLRVPALANNIDEAIEGDNGTLLTLRKLDSGMELQEWEPNTYALQRSRQIPGIPAGILRVPQGPLIIVARSVAGDVFFHVVKDSLEIVPPSSLLAPARFQGTFESADAFHLNWSAVQGALGYLIERRMKDTPSWETLARTDGTTTDIVDPKPSLRLSQTYRVTATNDTQLSPSAELVSNPNPPLAPHPPRGSVLSPFSYQLDWDFQEKVGRYVLEIFSDALEQWTELNEFVGTQTTFTYYNAFPGTTNRLRLRTTNFFGSSDPSEVLTITMPRVLPQAPSQPYTSTLEPFRVSVGWSSALYSTGGVIERRQPPGDWSVRGEVPSTLFYISNDPVLPATRYEYRSYATNDLGRSDYSEVVVVTTPPKPIPSIPYFVAVSPTSASSLELNWTSVENEDGFRIERQELSGENRWVQVTTLGPDRGTFTDSNLRKGIRYSYRILAFNDVGSSDFAYSEAVETADVVRVFEEPFDDAPRLFNWSELTGAQVQNIATNGPPMEALVFSGYPREQAVTLPLDLRNGGFLTFEVLNPVSTTEGIYNAFVRFEFSVDGGKAWTALPFYASLQPARAGWFRLGLLISQSMQTQATMLRWRTETFNNTRQNPWAVDNIQITALPPVLPSMPAYLASSLNSAHSVTLFWGPAAGARGFEIERRTGGAGWQPLAKSSANVLFFTDDSAMPGVVNAYRVRAVNPGGAGLFVGPTLAKTWTALEQWSYDQFGDPTFLNAARLDSPGADGLTPRLRYAFNLDATEPVKTWGSGGNSGFPKIWLDPERGVLNVEFPRRRNGTGSGITYEVQFSSDLEHWTVSNTPGEASPIDILWEAARYRDAVTVDQTATRYCRVVVKVGE